MTRSVWKVAASLVLLLVTGVAAPSDGWAQESSEEAFPHAEHEGLFPFCAGCHREMAAVDRSDRFPEQELCVRCHDGEELEREEWSLVPPAASNLEFLHADHPSDTTVDGERIECATCHVESGGGRMTVAPLSADRCLTCHEHEAERHYADADCQACHRPLAETAFSRARVEELPSPESHERDDFLLASGHGRLAEAGVESCSTCHTRERCASCHVDAGTVARIGKIPAASNPDLSLPAFEAEYPTPRSHESGDWLTTHGNRASAAECTTCHTRESCSTCHREGRPTVVARLPSAADVAAPGVTTSRETPPSHASPWFTLDHGTLASADGQSCSTCHREESCTECHQGQRGPKFHPPNFLARHSTEAYGSRLECANCHDNRAFCRECHSQLGMRSEGRLGGGFHDGVSAWLFRHGQAARQSLETCTTCHTQTDCLQCHSETGAFQIDPHGPGFDAEGARSRNAQICRACHLSDPLGGGSR